MFKDEVEEIEKTLSFLQLDKENMRKMAERIAFMFFLEEKTKTIQKSKNLL